MDVYFVRHGQTDGNAAHRHQHPHSDINEVGKVQVDNVAALLSDLAPTHLITSTHVRALETARVIGVACNIIPETYPPFEELHQPEYLVGERLIGMVTLRYVTRWFFNRPDGAMHDGESYEAFRMRLVAARRHLESLPADARVVVVSHSVFINFFIAHMTHPRRLGLIAAARLFLRILIMKNASIIMVRYSKTKAKHGHTGWRLMASY
jgi:broad specificity phosphatase PhoE